MNSIGVIETLGLSPALEALDAMLKAANVEVLRYDKLGLGWVIAGVRGDIGAVMVAVEAGRAAAGRAAKTGVTAAGITKATGGALDITPVGSCVIASPSPARLSFLRGGETGPPALLGGATGYVETMGFSAAIQALDAMEKGTAVAYRGYSGTPPKFVIWIQGDVAAVGQALQLGSEVAGRVGRAVGSCLLARPHSQTVENLPAKLTAGPITSLAGAMPRHIQLLPGRKT
jgi:microcompartment protein CcmL/EutN